MTGRLLAALLFLGWAGAAQGQVAPDTAARRAAMDRFAFLEGEWSGPAWAALGPGARVELLQTESVRRALGGQVLLIEGVGRRLVDGQPADTLYHAVGTLDWHPERGYLLRAYTLAGHSGDFAVTPAENGLDWEAPLPGGAVHYRMRLGPNGEWDERGEFVRGGQRYPVIGLLLTRTTRE